VQTAAKSKVPRKEEAIFRLRPFASEDLDAILDLSIRAWEPVFDSLEQALGSEIFLRMHPDWRADQRQTVEEACRSQDVSVWVAESEREVVGFVGIKTDDQARLGEVYIVAVDPAYQRSGVGTALTRLALDELADAGMTIAMVETGGDPGHAAARHLYEHTGFTLLPIARYFKAL
jgi:ribosomal protein S18 acetylase RimI-like enzyme